ncbi:hypothetical protein BT96DRAFT_1001292 [Gymnopus androsaceus JB14]|uniref:MJ1316 RNA cyclic group end recognition domain-containing protein n=1 Tax=Gymnopus androsaceus JB14 TaxID=1447944 RepID=A0A6A4H0C2_9AGAR|nr:hypothetical protein BT96DRAFT_1001292 [Gymnopus androsaceus JB14]
MNANFSNFRSHSMRRLPATGTFENSVSVPESTPHPYRLLLPSTSSLTNAGLVNLFTTQSWLPSAEQERKMAAVIETLRSTICPSNHASNSIQIRIECVGSYALGVHTCHSGVDYLAVGNVSSSTFWDLAKSRVRQNAMLRKRGRDVDVRLQRFVKDAIVQKMDLEVEGVRVDMQYCDTKNLVGEEWKNIGSLPSDSPLFLLPASSLVMYNAYRDVLTILKFLLPPSVLSAFSSLVLPRRISSHPSYSSCTYFGSIRHRTTGIEGAALGTQVLRWDWERAAVWTLPSREPELDSATTTTLKGCRRSPTKEPIRNSVEVMKRAFERADDMLDKGWSWAAVCGLDGEEVPHQMFLKQHKIFIKLEKGRAVVGCLESRIVSLLVQLHNVAPSINARFWPVRFADAGTVSADGSARDLNGFYLFGLCLSPSSSVSSLSQSRNAAAAEIELATLSSCLRTFETELPSNDKFLRFPKHISLRGRIDGFDPIDDDGDDDEEVEEENSHDDLESEPPLSRRSSTTHTPAPGKLRNMLVISYAVGYEDRFSGIKESMLRDWVINEVEHESFMPQHRIVYFRHVADDETVWDKRKKIVTVFGSGLGAGPGNQA